MTNIQPVILCGGSVTRLWPLSRKSLPKQFVPLIGHKSLLQTTFERVAKLAGDQPVQRTDVKPPPKEKKTAPIEQIVKLEKEMSQVQESYKDAEENYGTELLNLVVAKGYITKLLTNEAVNSYIARHQPEILSHLELVVNIDSMEEVIQAENEATEEIEDQAGS